MVVKSSKLAVGKEAFAHLEKGKVFKMEMSVMDLGRKRRRGKVEEEKGVQWENSKKKGDCMRSFCWNIGWRTRRSRIKLGGRGKIGGKKERS